MVTFALYYLTLIAGLCLLLSVAFNKFYPFVANIGLGKFDLNTDTINLALFTAATAPTTADGTYASNSGYTLNSSGSTEVATGGGYTANGQTLASTAYSQTSGTATLSCTGSATTWTASGSGFSLRYVVCYDITAGTAGARPLIGWWDYGSTVTLNAGDTFSVTLSSGVLTIA
jgi:hypothetical protein